MVFSSYLFLFYFLPVALQLYYAVPRRAQHLILTILSFIFYGWANPLFSFLLLFSALIDYIAGLVIALVDRGSGRVQFRGSTLTVPGRDGNGPP